MNIVGYLRKMFSIVEQLVHSINFNGTTVRKLSLVLQTEAQTVWNSVRIFRPDTSFL